MSAETSQQPAADVWSHRSDRPLQDRYWSFLALRDEYLKQPTQALRWWMSGAGAPLNPTERAIYEHVADAPRLLDIGAGDNRIKAKFRNAGYQGRYHTLDPAPEIEHDFRAFEEVPDEAFDAVLILEVIEHIPLDGFDAFIDDVLRVLAPRGRLVMTTPNAEYIGSLWASDMTHRHAYRVQDLAAYLHLRGVESTIHRIAWASGPRMKPKEWARYHAARLLTRGVLGVDYARGALVLARRIDE